jgi:hypothetical protein
MKSENARDFPGIVKIVKLDIIGQQQVGCYAASQRDAQSQRIDNDITFVLKEASKSHAQVIPYHDVMILDRPDFQRVHSSNKISKSFALYLDGRSAL